jgi:hypothetical protein
MRALTHNQTCTLSTGPTQNPALSAQSETSSKMVRTPRDIPCAHRKAHERPAQNSGSNHVVNCFVVNNQHVLQNKVLLVALHSFCIHSR